MSTKTVPTVYQQWCRSYQSSKTVKTQSKQHKNDHWCTSRHMSTKNVPTATKNSQKTVKTAKMTTGVPIVTGLPRLYQQCNNSLPIVNKNLAIANRSRVSCAHNTSKAIISLNITPWPWNLDWVTQGHWKRNHWTDHKWLTISRVIWR